MLPRYRSLQALLSSLLVGLAGPLQAAQPDRYLPNNTQGVVSLNVRQFLDAPMIHARGVDRLRAAFRSREPDKVTLETLGFDPLTAISQLIYTNSGTTEADRGLLILHGRFDPAIFHGRAAELVKKGNGLKLVRVGEYYIYEAGAFGIFARQKQHAYIALADLNTLVASAHLDEVVEALDKSAGRQQALLGKTLQELIARTDDSQCLWMAEVGNAALVRLASRYRTARDLVEPVIMLNGTISAGYDLRADFTLGFRDGSSARRFAHAVNVRLKEVLVFLAVAGKSRNDALEDSLKSFRAATNGATVALRGRISADAFDALLLKVE